MGGYALVAVGAGAAFGAWLRWWLGLVLNPLFPTLPLGTLVANLAGGYLIGIAIALLGQFSELPVELRLFIITGFLGGLTTFSTFSAETVTLIGRGQIGWAFVTIMAHVAGSLGMTGLGLLTVKLIRG